MGEYKRVHTRELLYEDGTEEYISYIDFIAYVDDLKIYKIKRKYYTTYCYKIPMNIDGKIEYRYIPTYCCEDKLLIPGDTIWVNDEGYDVIGSGKKMYRAINNNRETRKYYTNSKGELTFKIKEETTKELTFEEQFEKLSEQNKHYFKQFEKAISTGYNFDQYQKGIFKNFNFAMSSKQRLIDILSKHPNWNSDELCIEIPISLRREISYENIRNKGYELCEYISGQKPFNSTTSNIANTIFDLIEYPDFKIEDNVLKFRLDYHFERIRNTEGFGELNLNQKASRIVKQLCTLLGIECNSTFEQLFAAYSDELSIKEQDCKFILSVNPADFITMSHGNSWKSCHSTRDYGCYHAGCMSYATDNTTMIAYTIPIDSGKDYFDINKIKRQLFMLGKNQKCIMQSKMYPKNTDPILRDTFLDYVMELLGESGCEIPEGTGANTSIKTGTYTLHYPDYNYWRRLRGTADTIKVGNVSFGLQSNVKNINNASMLGASKPVYNAKYIITQNDIPQEEVAELGEAS